MANGMSTATPTPEPARRPTAPALTAALGDDRVISTNPSPAYAALRAAAPVCWHQPEDGPGWWIVTTLPEVLEVSRDPARFCSGRGILTMEIGVDYPSPPTMMHTDPPDHTRYRKLVQPGFAPSRIRALEAPVRALTKRILDELPASGVVDVVPSLAEPLPVHVIADLLGIPASDRGRFVAWSDATIPGASDLTWEESSALMAEMQAYLMETCRSRRGGTGTDLITVLSNVEVDGDVLTDEELLMFMNQLLVAGNETTRNMISGGLVALAENPEQMAALVADRSLIPACIEEWLRWTTPVVAFMRTATVDTELRGVPIRAGDPVLLHYAAANRDPDVFEEPESFRIGRGAEQHVAFGFGPHFCIGAALARLEGRVLLEELLDRWDTIEPGGPVEKTTSTIIAGLRSAPLRLAAVARGGRRGIRTSRRTSDVP